MAMFIRISNWLFHNQLGICKLISVFPLVNCWYFVLFMYTKQKQVDFNFFIVYFFAHCCFSMWWSYSLLSLDWFNSFVGCASFCYMHPLCSHKIQRNMKCLVSFSSEIWEKFHFPWSLILCEQVDGIVVGGSNL